MNIKSIHILFFLHKGVNNRTWLTNFKRNQQNNLTICVLCSKVFKGHRTQNLRRHLNNAHNEIARKQNALIKRKKVSDVPKN